MCLTEDCNFKLVILMRSGVFIKREWMLEWVWNQIRGARSAHQAFPDEFMFLVLLPALPHPHWKIPKARCPHLLPCFSVPVNRTFDLFGHGGLRCLRWLIQGLLWFSWQSILLGPCQFRAQSQAAVKQAAPGVMGYFGWILLPLQSISSDRSWRSLKEFGTAVLWCLGACSWPSPGSLCHWPGVKLGNLGYCWTPQVILTLNQGEKAWCHFPGMDIKERGAGDWWLRVRKHDVKVQDKHNRVLQDLSTVLE